MNLYTDDPTLGAASAPTDYQDLTSGWALGVVADQAWNLGGADSLARATQLHEQRFGQPTRAGTYMFRPGTETPQLSPDEANQRYGISGALTFDKPVNEGEAKLLNQWKRDEIGRNDALERSTPGVIPASARFLTNLVVSGADPINLAASMIPVFGEARWATIAGRIGATATRVLRGTAEGVVGSALAEPITALEQINEHGDYDAGTALMDIGYGAIGGAGLRAIGGAAHDLVNWLKVRAADRTAAFFHSMSAVTDGRPVRAAEIADATLPPERLQAAAIQVDDQVFTGATHDEAAKAARAAGVKADAIAEASAGFATDRGRFVSREDATAVAQAAGQGYRQVAAAGTPQPAPERPAKALDALAFIQSKGGLRNSEGHDLINAVGQRQNPQYGPLIRKNGGMSIDDAGEALHEAGFFGDPDVVPRPPEAEVIDFLRDAAGKKRYAIGQEPAPEADLTVARDMAGHELGRVIEQHGVNVSEQQRSVAVESMVKDGLSASDALDHVLERSAIEGGLFQSPAERLAAVEAAIDAADQAGASLADIAPLMDERAAIQADIEAQRAAADGRGADVASKVADDIRGGEGSASAAAVGQASSRQAEQEAALVPREDKRLAAAKQAAIDAEAKYRAIVGSAEPQALDEGAKPFNLLNSTTSELRQVAEEVRDQQDNGYAKVFGNAEDAKNYEHWNKVRLNTSDDAFAAELQKKVDDLVASLPPEKQKQLDDIDRALDLGDADGYEKLAAVSARYDDLNEATPEQVIKFAADDILKTNPIAVTRVLEGRGDIYDQANVLPFLRVYEDLRKRGVDAKEIRDRLVGEMRLAWGNDTAEIVDGVLERISMASKAGAPSDGVLRLGITRAEPSARAAPGENEQAALEADLQEAERVREQRRALNALAPCVVREGV